MARAVRRECGSLRDATQQAIHLGHRHSAPVERPRRRLAGGGGGSQSITRALASVLKQLQGEIVCGRLINTMSE